MTPLEWLRRRCQRYAVPEGDTSDLMPLVERGLSTRGPMGACLLAVAEASIAMRGESVRDQDAARERLDDRMLVALAGVLHGWEP